MKKVGIIHSVKVVCNSFDLMLKKQLDDVESYNLLDDWLSKKLQEEGGITPEIRERFVMDLQHQQKISVGAIVCTCSSLSKIVPEIRSEFAVPVLSIDENMVDKISDRSGRALIAATSFSAIFPLQNAILKHSERKGTDLEVTHIFLEDAGKIMHRGGDMQEHDDIVLDAIKHVEDRYDFIVFAQASLAHLRKRVEDITGKPVFTSPDYCIAELKEVLNDE